MSTTRTDRIIAAVLLAFGFFWLLGSEKDVGFTRDESVYFSAAENHARWFQRVWASPTEAFSDRAIVEGYDFNHEHPALMKNLFGLSYLTFHEKLGWFRPATAFRIPAFLVAALLLPLMYLLGLRLFGRTAGLIGAISFFLVPRQFYNAHLACFDVPITTMWVLTVYCFYRALETPRYWLYTGLSFGAAIATKHNGLFIPFVLAPFGLWRAFTASAAHPRARALFGWVGTSVAATALLYGVLLTAMGREKFQASFAFFSPQTFLFLALVGVLAWLLRELHTVDVATFRPLAALAAMVALGPVIFYLHWPYLWHAPVDRTAWYLDFHATHNHYTWYYLGELLREPPFPLAYVVVVTALTVPTSLFVPAVMGFVRSLTQVARRKTSLLELLVLANAVTSIAIISHPNVPHFGGVKHWFPSMPFLLILGGGTLARAADTLRAWVGARIPEKLAPWALPAVLSMLVFAPALIAQTRVMPYGTSFYSELAGGLPGAATLGMQRQFWAGNVTGVLDWLNKNVPPGARVYLHENHGGQIHDYQRNKMLRSDIGFVGDPRQADFVAYQYHQEFREHEFNTWEALHTTRPVYGLYVDETPQVIVYQRDRP